MSEHAEPTEPETDDDGVADAEFDLDAREWFRSFHRFVAERDPVSHAEDGFEVLRDGSASVRAAREHAVIAAYRAIGRMAGRFDPPPEMPPFKIDANRMGGDS